DAGFKKWSTQMNWEEGDAFLDKAQDAAQLTGQNFDPHIANAYDNLVSKAEEIEDFMSVMQWASNVRELVSTDSAEKKLLETIFKASNRAKEVLPPAALTEIV